MYNEPKTAPRNNNGEMSLYQKGDIHITNLRAVFGSKTYVIANITSVDSQRIESSGCGPATILIFGLLLLLVGIAGATSRRSDAGDFVMIVLGLFFLLGGLAIFRISKPSFSVNLTTAAGEVKAYTTADEATIRDIVEALNNAIIQKR